MELLGSINNAGAQQEKNIIEGLFVKNTKLFIRFACNEQTNLKSKVVMFNFHTKKRNIGYQK